MFVNFVNGASKESVSGIYEEIKSRIVSRKYLPDVKLNQNQIAGELDVSRTPVIKALHMLQSKGLVINIPNKGFYVYKASLRDTVEFYELRQAVEMIAAANVAEDATTDEIIKLKDIFRPFAGQKEINWDAYAEANQLFHSRLIELSDNRILQRTNQSVLILPKTFISGLLRSPQETLQEHFDLIDALTKRDVELAQEMAKKHLQLTIISLKAAMTCLRNNGVDPRKIPLEELSPDVRAEEISEYFTQSEQRELIFKVFSA